MVATASTMQALGALAPDFDLSDVVTEGRQVARLDYTGQPLLVMFICNHCPFVVHIIRAVAALGNDLERRGMAVVAISSNDIDAYPQDGPGPMAEFARRHGFKFPYCLDQSQTVAQAYGAVCTPDFFLYDHNHMLRYRGQFDASRPSNEVPVTGADLRAAALALLNGTPVPELQVASLGCSIKWRAGNQPEYS